MFSPGRKDSPLLRFLGEILAKGKLTAACILLGASSLAYLALVLSDGVAAAVIDHIAQYMTWAVPLMLAVSLALFHSLIRAYELVGEACNQLDSTTLNEEKLRSALNQIRRVVFEVVGNAFLALVLVAFYVVVRGLQEVSTTAVTYPDVVRRLRPEWIAEAFLFGLGVLMVALLTNQFLAIGGFVDLYRFLTVERRLEEVGKGGEGRRQ